MKYLAFGMALNLLVLTACSTTGGTDPTPAEPEEPEATEILPNRGSTSGGTHVTITGLHFAHATAGATRVTIGGLDATDVTVIDDQTITAVTAGDALPGPVNVVVRNDNGTALMEEAYEYLDPVIYAADGKWGEAGNLYRIAVGVKEPEAETIGAIGYAITGLAQAPDGSLWGTEATLYGTAGNSSRLIRIDAATGAGTVVGPLVDSINNQLNHDAVADITFVGERLLGWSEVSSSPVEIDQSTGVVTVIGTVETPANYGNGMAARGDGTVYLAGSGVGGNLSRVNPTTGEITVGPTLDGGSYLAMAALTFLENKLYGVDNQDWGQIDEDPCDLIYIDHVTGEIETIIPLPIGVDAISSNFLQ
jgi:hypothetical protein